MKQSTRKIIYIRARARPTLFVRFMGRQYFPVRQIRYRNHEEHHGYLIAVGDIVEIMVRERIVTMDVGEDSDFTEESKFALLEATKKT